MTVRVYKSTDASAPILTGETGKLNDLLYAILVTGYGATTAAGWTREYNDAASKTMVFRPAAGCRHYFQCADNGPGAGTYKEARIRGYETMSAYNTGTGPFPTVAQMANGLFVRKASAADATARPWCAVADEKTVHFFMDAQDAGGGNCLYSFGDINSWKAADAYASTIAARISENVNTYTSAQAPQAFCATVAGITTHQYAVRSYSGAGAAITLTNSVNAALMKQDGIILFGSVGETYPNPVDGGLLLSPIYHGEGTTKRGTARGLWAPCHTRPIMNFDTFSVTDGATTRDFIAVNLHATGQVFIETSSTWDTA